MQPHDTAVKSFSTPFSRYLDRPAIFDLEKAIVLTFYSWQSIVILVHQEDLGIRFDSLQGKFAMKIQTQMFACTY